MKRSLLAIGAACLAVSCLAATHAQQRRHAAPAIDFNRNVDVKGMKKTPAGINTPGDVIISADGRRQDMTVTASGTYVVLESLESYQDQQFPSHVIYGDKDDVYIFNIMPGLGADTYVKGVRDGDRIVVDLPQTVLWSEQYKDGVNVRMLDFVFDEETGDDDLIPAEDTSFVLSVASDGSLVAENLSERHVMGLSYCSDDMWAGFSVRSLSFMPYEEKPVVVPDDIEVSKDLFTYKCESKGYGWPVSFAQGGDEVYFQGLSEVMPEAWVKATVEYGDTEAHVFIDQNQLVGTFGGSFVHTKCAETLSFEMFGQVYEYYELLPDDYRFELIWDYENETITAKDPSVSLLFNIADDDVDYIDDMYAFVLSVQDSYEGTPLDPVDLDFEDMMASEDFSVFEFTLPALSADGDVLQTSSLGYVIYIDGEEWTFDADEYGLDESMSVIPWTFNSQFIRRDMYSCKHSVFLFVDGITSLGVQSVYSYDGVETRSAIVSIDVDPSGVAGIGSDVDVVSVRYYDMSGREVADPSAGIFVKRVVFEDGSVATFKKAVR
ncbi:MAG: hypothetical protein K2H22_01610 [Muribaculaceae bacterium]|nr:hypothetical protein [Muribaculaceae bacterium]